MSVKLTSDHSVTAEKKKTKLKKRKKTLKTAEWIKKMDIFLFPAFGNTNITVLYYITTSSIPHSLNHQYAPSHKCCINNN